jgi:hypothetical protein
MYEMFLKHISTPHCFNTEILDIAVDMPLFFSAWLRQFDLAWDPAQSAWSPVRAADVHSQTWSQRAGHLPQDSQVPCGLVLALLSESSMMSNCYSCQLSYNTARWTKCYTSHLCSITLINLVPLINPVMEALNSAQRPTILTDASTYVSAVVWMTYQFFWDVTQRPCVFGSWHFETKVLHGCFDPWWWDHYSISKCQEAYAQWRGVTFQKIWYIILTDDFCGVHHFLQTNVKAVLQIRWQLCLPPCFPIQMCWSSYYSTLYRLNYWQHC